MKVKRITTLAILTSLAIAISITESFIPLFVPGIKLGLANIVTLVILFLYSKKEALITHYLRLFIVGLLYSGIFSISFLLSIISGTISILVMILLSKTHDISITSTISSICHVLTELFLLSIILKTDEILINIPIYVLIATLTGLLTSIIAILVLRSFKLDYKMPNKICYIVVSILVLISVIPEIIILKSLDKKGDYATIILNNEEIIKIDLEDPEPTFKSNDYIISYSKENNKIYTFSIEAYNYDDKEKHIITFKIENSKIQVLETSCKRKICFDKGEIDSKFDTIICVPNRLIVKIESDESEIDFKK